VEVRGACADQASDGELGVRMALEFLPRRCGLPAPRDRRDCQEKRGGSAAAQGATNDSVASDSDDPAKVFGELAAHGQSAATGCLPGLMCRDIPWRLEDGCYVCRSSRAVSLTPIRFV
jgi:hypothetical protein